MRVINTELKMIDGELAAEMLSKYHYERQRRVSQAVVKYYAAEMDAGRFTPGSELIIAYVPNGDSREAQKGFLVNGQHRLWAQIDAQRPTEYLVKHMLCESDVELSMLYSLTDVQKKRNHADAYRAAYMYEHLGLTVTQTNALGAAVKFIHSGFKKASSLSLSLNELLSTMTTYGDASGRYFECIAGCTNYMQSVMQRAATMSVALVTLDESINAFGIERVEKFWWGVALDDGLHVGDPRKTANKHLLSSSLSTSSAGAGRKIVSHPYSARYLANCFNAYVEGREIVMSKVMDASAPINIAGSKFKG